MCFFSCKQIAIIRISSIQFFLILVSSVGLISQEVIFEGELDVQDHHIHNVANPEVDNDAATKHYVDSVFGELKESIYETFAVEYPTTGGIQALIDQGYSIQDLQTLGYDTVDLVEYGLLDSIYRDSSSFVNLLEADVSIQQLLNAGARPTDMYKGGIPLDSIYGKFYEGGLIFFLDTLDDYECFDGLVASPIEYSPFFPQIDSIGPFDLRFPCSEYNTQVDPLNEDMGVGKVLSYMTIGHKDCRVFKESESRNLFRHVLEWQYNDHGDWYVPSLYELMGLYQQLHMIGLGNYRDRVYWSASEEEHVPDAGSSTHARAIDFDTGENVIWPKSGDGSYLTRVIPIRQFGDRTIYCPEE